MTEASDEYIDSSGLLVDNNLYESVAAQNAFFNAPKITTRNWRVKPKAKETDDEEEAEQEAYDENTDRELNEKIAQHLKDFFAKKITAKNAFETPILDKLPTVAQIEPLQCVGAMLDASARVYAFRVDNTHCECFNVRTNIDEDKKKKNDVPNNSFDSHKLDENSDNNDINDNDDDKCNDQDIIEINDLNNDDCIDNVLDEQRVKKKKKGFKGLFDTELPGRLNNLYEKSINLVNKFCKFSLIEETGDTLITEEILLDRFEDYSSQVFDILTFRRVGVPFIEQKMLGLNRTAEEYCIDDPIYHKVAKQFEEGCAQSFVNNEVLTNDDGNFLIIHNNWKNNEPSTSSSSFIVPELVTKEHQNLEILECIEGSLERALVQNPCGLPLLEEFCEEDEEICENELIKSRKIRLLGRKSQECSKTENLLDTPVAKKSKLSTSNESGDGYLSSSSLTDDEKTRREHEELIKFQMYLDEDLGKKEEALNNPFEGFELFPNNFAYSYLKQDNRCAVHKALLHAITDDDAKQVGIPLDLMAKIRLELKTNRLLSEKLMESVLALPNNAQLNYFTNLKLLCFEDNFDDFPNAENGLIINYAVTRFAPLIDSIWHSVIKVANEEDLIKAKVFVGGGKNFQKTLTRHHTLKLSAQRYTKNRPFVTPIKAISSSSTLSSTPLTIKSQSRIPSKKLNYEQESATKYILDTPKSKKIDSYEEINDLDSLINQNSQNSLSAVDSKTSELERIYFWAKPRQYPIVYLGQIIDERDSMLQDGIEMSVDMEEMLLDLDEAAKKKSTLASVPENTSSNDLPINNDEPASSVVMEVNDNLDNNKLNQINEILIGNVELNQNSCDDKNIFDIVENNDLIDDNRANAPVEDIFEDALPFIDNLDENTDNGLTKSVFNNLNESFKEKDNDLLLLIPEDQSHWKCADSVPAENAVLIVDTIKKEKKTKKHLSAKPKRKRLNSNNNAEMGGSLTEEMFWQPADEVNPEILKSIKKHQTKANPADLVYNINHRMSTDPKLFLENSDFPIDILGAYNPMRLIQSSLFYSGHLGFWKFETIGSKKVSVFCARRDNFLPKSIDDQYNEFFEYYFQQNKSNVKTEFNKNLEKDNVPLSNHYSLDDSINGLSDNEYQDAFDELDVPNHYNKNNNLTTNVKEEEHLEFNGGIIKIRQSRVKAPMVKKAMALILSSKKNSMDSLLEMRKKYSKNIESNHILRNNKENCVIEDKVNSSFSNDGLFSNNDLQKSTLPRTLNDNKNESSSEANKNIEQKEESIFDEEDYYESEESSDSHDSSLSGNESDEENDKDNNNEKQQGVQGLNVHVDGFKIEGEHTFENLLTFLPNKLSGQTKRDLNVINAFAITLHMCNEHQLKLIQDKDKETLLVKPKAMSSFSIQLASNGRAT